MSAIRQKMKALGKVVNSENTFAFSWILMWALAYIVCAILKPDLSEGAFGSIMIPVNPVHLGFGLLLLLALVFNIKALLFGCGIFETCAGVASYVGMIRWNVPWSTGYDSLAQISMAFLDLISAVVLFTYSLTLRDDTDYWK